MRRLLLGILFLLLWLPAPLRAAPAFKLTLSPVFLNVTLNPGEQSSASIKVTNGGASTEELRVGVMKFKSYDETGKPELMDIEPSDTFASWVAFSPSTFTLEPGRSTAVTATFSPPNDAALGYYYAITFERANPPAPGDDPTKLAGRAAVLVLLEVSSADAARQLDVAELSTDRRWYDFLPVTFKIRLTNNGNIHVAPRGNIFIDRGGATDLAILEVNQAKGNILPQSSRVFTSEWSNGFPVRQTETADGAVVLDEHGQPVRHLIWNWSNADKLRWGKYTAHMVLVYDDGQRDVPIEASVSFWVIPWQLLAAIGLLLVLSLVGIWSVLRGLKRRLRRRRYVDPAA